MRESPYRAPAGDRFSDLDWMIGEWVAEGPHATAEASCAWGPGKSYILRQVTVTPKGAEPISATQWIGWDPIHERIRSFVFDSHGGYGDGIWEKEGDAWVVTATGVLPDGRHTKVTNLYSQIDENTALWESVDEEIDGRPGVDLRLRHAQAGKQAMTIAGRDIAPVGARKERTMRSSLKMHLPLSRVAAILLTLALAAMADRAAMAQAAPKASRGWQGTRGSEGASGRGVPQAGGESRAVIARGNRGARASAGKPGLAKHGRRVPAVARQANALRCRPGRTDQIAPGRRHQAA